jgi:O-acetyl-ADP-ribose deacetylase (regulator of RNase III)
MIHDITGDIQLSKARPVAYGVAPNDPCPSGLAFGPRENWLYMCKEFRHFCQTTHSKAEKAWVWGGIQGSRIINLFTQDAAYDPGTKKGKATVEHTNHALRGFRQHIKKEKFTSPALPRLGTGVGSLNWEEVNPLISKHLGDLKVPAYVYVAFQKGIAANESV